MVPLYALLSRKVPEHWDVLPAGNLPRSPCAPVGAFCPAQQQTRMRLPFPRGARFASEAGWGQIMEDPLASPMIRNTGPFPQSAALLASRSVKPTQGFSSELTGSVSRSQAFALSVEFVAKPEKAVSARISLADAIDETFQEIDSYAGCMVLISEQEPRLITVITFWKGSHDRRRCHENTQSVDALLASYVDRRLRVQTLVSPKPLASGKSPREELHTEWGPLLEDWRARSTKKACVSRPGVGVREANSGMQNASKYL